MDEKIFQRYDGDQVTDGMFEQASKLFCENYGVWSEQAAQLMGKFAKAGSSAYTSSYASELTGYQAVAFD